MTTYFTIFPQSVETNIKKTTKNKTKQQEQTKNKRKTKQQRQNSTSLAWCEANPSVTSESPLQVFVHPGVTMKYWIEANAYTMTQVCVLVMLGKFKLCTRYFIDDMMFHASYV